MRWITWANFRATQAALILCCALGAGIGPARAQQQGIGAGPWPVGRLSGSGTISSTNVFQQVFSAWAPGVSSQTRYRSGCTIINTGTHVQWVFFGSLTSATTPDSVPLNPASVAGQAGGSVLCNVGGSGVLQSQISISGTSGDSFYAGQQ